MSRQETIAHVRFKYAGLATAMPPMRLHAVLLLLFLSPVLASCGLTSDPAEQSAQRAENGTLASRSMEPTAEPAANEVIDSFTGQVIPGLRPTILDAEDAATAHLRDGTRPHPTLEALLDLFERGVVHPMAPRQWRVSGLASYATLNQTVASGDLYAVEDQLNGGANVQEIDSEGRTPLLTAALGNQPYIADLLLEHGANLSDKDVLGNSVMHLAARATHIYTLENFFRHGADIEARNFNNYTPLHQAAEAGDIVAVHHLLQLGADRYAMQDKTVLSIPAVLAARKRHWDVTRYFRSRNLYFSIHLMAAQGDKPGVIEALDDLPTAIDLLDALQNTPLMSAVKTGECEMVKLLLERGADTGFKNVEGDTALDLAIRLNRNKCIQYLQNAGAQPSALR